MVRSREYRVGLFSIILLIRHFGTPTDYVDHLESPVPTLANHCAFLCAFYCVYGEDC